MYCSKCGNYNENEASFCLKCGNLLHVEQVNNQFDNQVEETVLTKQETKIINPNMKKYSVISIIIGAGGIFFALFVGMSLWLSLILASFGFTCANKGKISDKKLSIVGYVLNSILLGMGVIIYIYLLITRV